VTEKGQKDDGTAYANYRRVDEYWHKILQITDLHGQPKFPSLGIVVKAALCLSHGQADVERVFSINKQVLEDRTTLSEQTLRATRTVKDVINRYDSSIIKVPITRKLLQAHKNSYQLYKDSLEVAKNDKEQALKRKRETAEIDANQQIKRQKKEWTEKQMQAEKMIAEGTHRLEEALKNSKLADAIPAQALLETGNKLL
jgi:hypothetical protein